MKVRRRKTKARGRAEPAAARPRDSSVKRQKQRAQPTREATEAQRQLAEVLEQQAATSEILGIIARSGTDVQSVLDIVCQSAARLCEAYDSTIWRPDGDRVVPVAHYGPITQVEALPLVRGTIAGRTILEKRTLHIADVYAQADEFPESSKLARRLSFRTVLSVPLIRQGAVIGTIALRRAKPRRFTERQVAVLQTFADEAVIAIENARLLNELRQRTDDLTESLEQQTATSEVLGVISSSPGDLQQVFEAMLENATRICDAKFGNLALFDGKDLRVAAMHNAPPALEKLRRTDPVINLEGSVGGTVVRTRQRNHVLDLAAEELYAGSILAKVAGARTALAVPMLREDTLVGVIAIYRRDVRPFSDKQIALVQNFAAQAVIAIENTRLLRELRQRTDDLTESLEQQTATSEVLKVISSSPGELDPTFGAMLESAARIGEAGNATIFLRDGDVAITRAQFGSMDGTPIGHRTPLSPGLLFARSILETRTIHVTDLAASDEFPDGRERARRFGYRATLAVPLVREGIAIGAIVVRRPEPRAFTDKEVELVTNFAAQAVIAIENARLLSELRERTGELELASRHKSQFLANMSHELRTPLNAILGYTELIGDGIYGQPPEKMFAVLKRLERNGKHLLGLINDVLDLSKIEAGELKLSLTDYSITDMVATVLTSVEPLATAKKLVLRSELPADLPPAHGDERRIAQVLLNLLGNAIKFTDVGEISVRASAGNGSYAIAVRDTGPGISEVDQAKLFQEFHQVDNSITRKKGGTGLGLAISKRIIEMHGGRIWVESSPGHGSTFSFTVPTKVEQHVGPS
jgi:signal transduction histidine kinase